jgi:hypothetical protein
MINAGESAGSWRRRSPYASHADTINICADTVAICAYIVAICADINVICADTIDICADTVAICADINVICADTVAICADIVAICADINVICADSNVRPRQHYAERSKGMAERIDWVPKTTSRSVFFLLLP